MGGPVTMRGRAEFPYQMILIYGTHCANLEYTYTMAPRCTDAELTWDMEAGARVWLWHAPSVFEGVPESNYVFTVTGIRDPAVPVEETSWGTIKAKYAGTR